MDSRAAAKKAIVISLTALGISIGAAVLSFLIHYIYTDIHDVSPIKIVITRVDDNPLTTITKITHNGKEAVSNLHVTLRIPNEITSCSYFTSVKNMTLETWDRIPCSKDMTLDKTHSNVLIGTVPKFESGSGSVIEIYTSTSSGAKTIYDGGYSAHAVYDEGSVKRELKLLRYCITFSYFCGIVESYFLPGTLPWWEETSEQFHTLDVTVRKSILIGGIIIVLSLIAWLITLFYDSLKGIYRDARRKLR
jgi:hypothetical protein